MRYVEWVEAVLAGAVKHMSEDEYRGSIGIGIAGVANAVGVGMDKVDVQHALDTAGRDLASMGLVEHERWMLRVRPDAIKVVRAGGLGQLWPELFRSSQPLPEDLKVLQSVVAASEVQGANCADMQEVELKDVLVELGLEASQMAAHAISDRLRHERCIDEPLLTNAMCIVRPTYIGAVIATQREPSKLLSLLNEIVEGWETTSVDVKEVVRLDTERERAEFSKDILALANTLVSSRRFMVLGYNDRSRRFTSSVDPAVDAHRMESVLSANCVPVPAIRYSVVEVAGGQAGLIEVLSERAQLPYRVSRDVWKLKAATVYVRHNTLAVPIAGPELEALEAEGRRARGE